MQGPQTVQEAIVRFMDASSPDKAELIRCLDDRQTFAVLADRLPHATEAGCVGQVIALLNMWGAWHGLYPVDRAIQVMLRGVDNRASPVDSC